MEILETTIRKSGYIFGQVWREDEYAIYKQTCRDTFQVHAFEAFRIRRTEAKTVIIANESIQFQAKEHYPRDEDFGITAFSCKSFEQAMEKILQLKFKEDEERVKILTGSG